jgi:uncharacterized membrane protein
VTPVVKKLGIALAVSLGLCAFLAGFVVMGLLRGPCHGRLHGPGPLAHGEKGPHFRQLLHGHEKELSGSRRELRAARKRVQKALEAEPFDKARLEGELANLRAETARSQEAVHNALVEAASSMTPEQRRHLPVLEGRRGR